MGLGRFRQRIAGHWACWECTVPEANMTMHNADVIFAVGVRFDDRTTNNLAKYCPNATVLHIDIDPTSISKTVTADIPIVGMLAGPRTNA